MTDPMTRYEHRLEVVTTHIDEMGHVNNLRYLEWAIAAAVAHSAQNGWTFARYQEIGAAWVVRGHAITYYRPALLGDAIAIRTWIAERSRVTSRRRYLIERITGADRVLLAEAHTDWAFVDLTKGTPCRIPPEVIASFPVVSDESEPSPPTTSS